MQSMACFHPKQQPRQKAERPTEASLDRSKPMSIDALPLQSIQHQLRQAKWIASWSLRDSTLHTDQLWTFWPISKRRLSPLALGTNTYLLRVDIEGAWAMLQPMPKPLRASLSTTDVECACSIVILFIAVRLWKWSALSQLLWHDTVVVRKVVAVWLWAQALSCLPTREFSSFFISNSATIDGSTCAATSTLLLAIAGITARHMLWIVPVSQGSGALNKWNCRLAVIHRSVSGHYQDASELVVVAQELGEMWLNADASVDSAEERVLDRCPSLAGVRGVTMMLPLVVGAANVQQNRIEECHLVFVAAWGICNNFVSRLDTLPSLIDWMKSTAEMREAK